jgi:DNA-directed RNA polymerase subunit RPC12/RpoP
MRFILDKPYRGYAELGEYSDEECEQMMLEARARRADAMWFVPLVLIVAMVVVVAVTGAVTAWLVHRARVNAGSTLAFWSDPDVRVIFSWAVVVVGPPAVAIWFFTRRELIMRSVLNHLTRASCPYCRFSLAGLPIEKGAVRCPECGQRIVLAEEGIKPDDLLPRRETPTAWRPWKSKPVELPAIPLEPEVAPERRKRIRVFGLRREW